MIRALRAVALLTRIRKERPELFKQIQEFSCGGADTLGRLSGRSVSASPLVRTTYSRFDSWARNSDGSSQAGEQNIARPARTTELREIKRERTAR